MQSLAHQQAPTMRFKRSTMVRAREQEGSYHLHVGLRGVDSGAQSDGGFLVMDAPNPAPNTEPQYSADAISYQVLRQAKVLATGRHCAYFGSPPEQ